MPKPGSDSKPNISYPTVSLMTNKFLINRKKTDNRKTDWKELVAEKTDRKRQTKNTDRKKTKIETQPNFFDSQ